MGRYIVEVKVGAEGSWDTWDGAVYTWAAAVRVALMLERLGWRVRVQPYRGDAEEEVYGLEDLIFAFD